MNRIIGKCGNCGGNVAVPSTWLGIYPPTPSCLSCGSTPRDDRNPIPMNPPLRITTESGLRADPRKA